MTSKHKAPNIIPREAYEPPMAISLNDVTGARGKCNNGSAVVVCTVGQSGHNVGYREHGFTGVCVTGKSATDGCYAGAGVL